MFPAFRWECVWGGGLHSAQWMTDNIVEINKVIIFNSISLFGLINVGVDCKDCWRAKSKNASDASRHRHSLVPDVKYFFVSAESTPTDE